MTNPTISNKVKETVWQNYTSKPSSKVELKKIFLSDNPGEAYNKIKDKIKKELDKEAIKDQKLKSEKKEQSSKTVPKVDKEKKIDPKNNDTNKKNKN